MVTHFPFNTKETFQSTFVYDFLQSKQNRVKVLVIRSIILKLQKKSFKFALGIAIEADREHPHIIVLFYCF